MTDEKPTSTADAASARIRETAKWFAVALASIGAVLAAGTQLGALGHLDWLSMRFNTATVGLALALVGVGLALWFVIAVQTSPTMTLDRVMSESRNYPQGAVAKAVGDAGVLLGRPSVDEVDTELRDASVQRKVAFNAHRDDPSDIHKATAAAAADAALISVATVAARVIAQAHYAELAHRWKRARLMLLVGSVVAAAGITTFAWAVNPPPAATQSAAAVNVVATPSAKTLRLSTVGQDNLRDRLGSSCDATQALDILVLGETSSGPDVLIREATCTPVRVLVLDGWGSVS